MDELDLVDDILNQYDTHELQEIKDIEKHLDTLAAEIKEYEDRAIYTTPTHKAYRLATRLRLKLALRLEDLKKKHNVV